MKKISRIALCIFGLLIGTSSHASWVGFWAGEPKLIQNKLFVVCSPDMSDLPQMLTKAGDKSGIEFKDFGYGVIHIVFSNNCDDAGLFGGKRTFSFHQQGNDLIDLRSLKKVGTITEDKITLTGGSDGIISIEKLDIEKKIVDVETNKAQIELCATLLNVKDGTKIDVLGKFKSKSAEEN